MQEPRGTLCTLEVRGGILANHSSHMYSSSPVSQFHVPSSTLWVCRVCLFFLLHISQISYIYCCLELRSSCNELCIQLRSHFKLALMSCAIFACRSRSPKALITVKCSNADNANVHYVTPVTYESGVSQYIPDNLHFQTTSNETNHAPFLGVTTCY